jgi:hypothetical protein
LHDRNPGPLASLDPNAGPADAENIVISLRTFRLRALALFTVVLLGGLVWIGAVHHHADAGSHSCAVCSAQAPATAGVTTACLKAPQPVAERLAEVATLEPHFQTVGLTPTRGPPLS